MTRFGLLRGYIAATINIKLESLPENVTFDKNVFNRSWVYVVSINTFLKHYLPRSSSKNENAYGLNKIIIREP